MEVHVTVGDDAYNDIMTAIRGTGDNQMVIYEMLMNTTMGLVRLIDAVKLSDLVYSTLVTNVINTINMDILNAQVKMLHETLEAMDKIRNG